MPPMQQKLRPSKPCSPEVPTQSDINAIVGATQPLEGQNSVLNQIMYDIIQGRYGEPSQTSLPDSLSVFICLYGRTSPVVQSVGGVC
jgi:hypothetical protein